MKPRGVLVLSVSGTDAPLGPAPAPLGAPAAGHVGLGVPVGPLDFPVGRSSVSGTDDLQRVSNVSFRSPLIRHMEEGQRRRSKT